jgi:hypothetical protein
MIDNESRQFRMDENDWRQVKKLSGLSDEARPEIEFIISRLGSDRPEEIRHDSATTRKTLKAAYDQLCATCTTLELLIQDVYALKAIELAENFNNFFRRPRVVLRRFKELKGCIDDRAKELHKVLSMWHVRRGPKPDQPLELVSLLDNILHDTTGRQIRRTSGKSDLDWIEIICNQIEPGWGRGQIQAAMKDIEADNRKTLKLKRSPKRKRTRKQKA